MTLTAASIRNDLKCGRGAISEGEKCTKGPATKVAAKPATKKPQSAGSKKAQTAVLTAYAGLTIAGLYQLKNVRQAYGEKFNPAQRYKPFEETLGSPSDVLANLTRSAKQAAPSLFGDVSFGKYKDKDVVVKSFGKKGLAGMMQIRIMQKNNIISADTADALIRGQKALQVNEVQGALLAGQQGIGPKVVAAGNVTRRTLFGPEQENVLITKVARGRPLSSQSALMRQGPKLQEQLQRDPGPAIKKIAALQWRGLTKGNEISAINKDRIITTMGRMHTLGMSHNDLHPGNIFISKEGAQFIDFGTSDRGGASVASEFIRLMNPPRTGLQQAGGMGYNLRTADPQGYQAAESRMRSVIGKRIGKLTSADIQRALKKSKNKEKLESDLQRVVDEFYIQYGSRSRGDSLTPASLRVDAKGRPCGESHIPRGRTCHKKASGFPTRTAVATGLTAAALGAGALAYSRRRKPRGFGRLDAAGKTVFLNKKLHAAVKAEAKRKFKIYPSAYANAWMVREYKERGGKFRTDSLDKWFKEKWVRMSSTGRILGSCGDRSKGEGKPKCLPAKKASALSAAERRRLVARKRREDPRKERTGGPVMVSSKTDIWATGFDTEDGKKYSKKVRDPKTGRTRTVRYGAKGYKIAPGTDKGDRYCARSFGDMKSHGKDCSSKDRNTPLCLSRAKWRCSGKVSRRDGLTPGKF